jgi:tetraacyldisaccharide 4'-kinase
MMRQPAFWQHGRGGLTALALSPVATLVGRATARRVAQPGFAAPVPVICCGNATVGGAGKTIVASELAARLLAHGVRVALLTRGFGGKSRGLLRVDPARHRAADVGDEALLLAALAPTFVCADRAAAARAAVAAGAQALIMDDGMQNPGLVKTLSLLVVDGATGFGNGRVLPAGPLRETVAACAARAGAAVLIGPDRTGARALLPPTLPVLCATLRPAPGIDALRGLRVLAFAGIGHPDKFFAMLAHAGVVLAATEAFGDHHHYSETEVGRLIRRAASLDAVPVTTPKDHVRLGAEQAGLVTAIGVSLAWDDEAAVEALLARTCR